MPNGLEIFKANGGSLINVGTRLTRHCGIVATGTGPGSVTIPDEAGTGTVFYMLMPPAGITFSPRVTISGRTLYWSFDNPGNQYNASNYLIYGLF